MPLGGAITTNQEPRSGSHHREERAGLPTGLARSISLAIGEPVRVVEIDDGDGRTLIVEPLQFHRVCRFRGRAFVSKTSHAVPIGEQIPPSQLHKY